MVNDFWRSPFISFSIMYWLLALVFCICGVLPLAFSDDVLGLEKNIAELQENTEVITKSNVQLASQLEEAKRKCEATLAPLKKQQENILAGSNTAVIELGEVNGNITELELEEEMLVRNLNFQNLLEFKFKLKVLLHSQELELYTMRKQNGDSEKCHKLRPLFDKYGAAIGTRSMGNIRHQKRPKDYLIVLQNQLNQVKIQVKAERKKNEQLRNELKKQEKLCMATIISIRKQLTSSTEKLKEMITNLNMMRVELNETLSTVKGFRDKLKERIENNKLLEAEARQLKENLKVFNSDIACYNTLSSLRVNYKQ